MPGLNDSDENHWQTYWLRLFKNSQRLIQDNWGEPQLKDWMLRLDQMLSTLDGNIILVAHSLAVSLVAHWAAKNNIPKIGGALLVAPSDVESPLHTPDVVRNFAPMPTSKISFPTIVVASENDTFVDIARAQYFATRWGSEFINVGMKGHINSASNLGYWEEGQTFLQKLLVSA